VSIQAEVVGEVLAFDPVVLAGEESVVIGIGPVGIDTAGFDAGGGEPGGEVDRRIDQQLAGEWSAAVAAVECDARGEIAAGAVTGQCDPVDAAAEAGDVVVRPVGGGEAVLVAGREGILGREAVFHVEDDGPDGAGARSRLLIDTGGHQVRTKQENVIYADSP